MALGFGAAVLWPIPSRPSTPLSGVRISVAMLARKRFARQVLGLMAGCFQFPAVRALDLGFQMFVLVL